MKKVLLATLVAAMLLCSMIGCKGEDKKPAVTTTPDVTTPSTTTDGSGTTNPGDTSGEGTEVYVPNPYGVGAFVSTASDSNFEYELYENGAVVSAYKGSETAVTLPTAIGDKTVYGVANNAFANSSVKSVVVPAGYTVIGESAFMGSKALESIQLPDSLKELRADAFKYCEKLTAVSIPATVTKIGEKLFYGCSALTTVNIPTGVTTDEATTVTAIPDSMFFGCTSLKSIVIPATIKTVGANAFYFCTSLETAALPASVITVSSSAFYNCAALKEVVFPEGLISVGASAYFGCASIKTVSFPASLTNIGNGVFSGCTALTDVKFPAPVYDEEGELANELKVGNAAFAGCTSLTKFEIPVTVNLIPAGLFNGCTSLETIVLSNAANKIGDYAFAGTAIKSFVVPETVTNIGSRVFRGCTALESVDIHGAVTAIGAYAFENCTALKSITIPSTVKTVSEGLCSGCTALSSVKISNGTTGVSTLAFYGCPALKSIELPGTISDIKRYAFAFNKGEASFEVILPSGETEIQVLPTDYAVDKSFVLYGFTETISADYCKENGIKFVATGNKDENAFADFEYVIGEIQVPTKITDENGQLVDTVVTQKVITFNKYLGTKEAVVIPTTINDAIAYKIGDDCFKNAAHITSVDVPDTVISVGNNAFSGCTALNKISIPEEGIESYGKYAFAGTLIKEFTIDKATVIPEGMFQNCTKLEKITIKYKTNSGLATTEIGAYAFENCPIAKFTIPDTVTTIGNGAFLGCVNISSLDVPDSVKNLGAYALGFVKVDGAYKLIADHTYDVVTEKPILDAEGNPVLDAEGNPTKEIITETFNYTFSMGYFDGAVSENYVNTYKVEGRLLGNAGETPFKSFLFDEIKDANDVVVAYAIKLCLNTTAAEIVVPTSYNGLPVTKIATGAFSNKSSLEKIVIGASITTICEKSFNGCKKLTSCEILGNNVEFPDSASPWYSLTKNCVIYVNAGSKTQENINAISGSNRYTVLEFGQVAE